MALTERGAGGRAALGQQTLSVDDLASLEETLDIAGRPHRMRQIHTSLTDLSVGDTETLTKDEILRILT